MSVYLYDSTAVTQTGDSAPLEKVRCLLPISILVMVEGIIWDQVNIMQRGMNLNVQSFCSRNCSWHNHASFLLFSFVCTSPASTKSVFKLVYVHPVAGESDVPSCFSSSCA